MHDRAMDDRPAPPFGVIGGPTFDNANRLIYPCRALGVH